MKLPKFTLRGFKRPREAILHTLGTLDRKVMEEAWRCKEVSVRDVVQTFDEQTAYTTIMSTLDRLHKWGLLGRRKQGRAYLYRPRVSREQMEQSVAKNVIDGLLDSGAVGAEPILACIVDAVSELDRETLDELDRLVKEKRRELWQPK